MIIKDIQVEYTTRHANGDVDVQKGTAYSGAELMTSGVFEALNRSYCYWIDGRVKIDPRADYIVWVETQCFNKGYIDTWGVTKVA